MKVCWLHCIIGLCVVFGARSQCIDSLTNVPDTACLGEKIEVAAPGFVNGDLLWDFDSDNSFSELTLDTLESQTISSNFGIDVVYDSTIGWMSFTSDQTSNRIYIMEFANGLQEPSTASYSLNVPNNTFGNPASIDVLSYQGEWYGFVLCRNPAKVIQLNFGSSLGNIPQVHEVLGADFTSSNSYMCATIMHDSAFVFINDFFGNKARTYFSASLGSPLLEFSHEFELTESSGLRNMRVLQKCDKLYGIAVSSGSRNFHVLNFGASFLNTPQINSFNSILSDRPSQCDIIEEGLKIYMTYCSVEGRFYTVDLGQNLDSISPVLITPTLPKQGGLFSLATAYDKGNWSMYSYLSQMLFLNFQESDSLSIGSSIDNANEVSYFTPGTYQITLRYTDSANKIQLLSKNIVIRNNLASTYELESALNYCLDSATAFSATLINGTPGVSFTWNVGGSMFSGGQDTSIVFDSSGTYDVNVTIVNSDNCPSFAGKTVQLYEAPIASFSLDDTIVCVNSSIPFINTSVNTADTLTTWQWDFGDGNGSTSFNPTHQFVEADTFVVTLTAHLPSCSNSYDSTIILNEAPEVVLRFDDDCALDTIQFNNNTDTSLLSSFYWDFGDGSTSDSLEPTHVYDSPGAYIVSFNAAAKNLCDLVQFDTITIYNLPGANFGYSDSCEQNPILFQDLSLAPNDSLVAWDWTLTSSTGIDTSTAQNPIFTFNADSLIIINLKVSSARGCVNEVVDSIAINDLPQVDFDVELGCNNDSIIVTTNSQVSSEPFSVLWTVNSEESQKHESSFAYFGQDSVLVSLVVTDAASCSDSLSRWQNLDKQFVIDFDIPDSVCINERLIFQNNNLNFDHYLWNISDNDFTNNGVIQSYAASLGLNLVRGITSFQDPNTAVVHVLIADQNRNEIVWLSFDDELSKEPTVHGSITSNLLLLPDDLELRYDNGEIICLATSSSSSNLMLMRFGDQMNLNPQIEEIAFDLTNVNASLSYFNEGDTLYAFQTDFLSDVINRIQLNTSNYQIEKLDTITIPDGGARGIVVVEQCGEVYGFGINSTTGDVYKFIFGSSVTNEPEILVIGQLPVVSSDIEIVKDGRAYYLFISSVTGRYYKIGLGADLNNEQFNILEDTNFDQKLASTLALNLATAGSDYVVFLYSNEDQVLHGVHYSNASNGVDHTSTEAIPLDLSLSNPGWYQVSLQTEALGQTYKSIDSIYVRSDSSSLFQITLDSNQCLSNPSQFSFQRLSDQAISTNLWAINGDSVSVADAFMYQFDTSTTYHINLTVNNEFGCSNTLDTSYIIYERPVAQIQLPAEPYCTLDELEFENVSLQVVDSIVSWNWSVDTVLDTSSFNLIYSFNSSGSKNISLSAQIPGCTDIDTVQIEVEAGSDVNFISENHCQNDSVFLIDQTIGANITDYNWMVDTVSIPGDSSTFYIFDSSGTYTISLELTNESGCKNTLSKQLVIYPVPTVDFETSISCSDWPTDFIDRSTLLLGSIDEWVWTLDNQQVFSTARNPSIRIEEAGTHLIRLRVKSDQNCVDSVSRNMNTFVSPRANFSTDPVCFGESNLFVDESIDDQFEIEGWLWQIEDQVYINAAPLHIFSTIDTFEVSLTVTNDIGCRGDTIKQVVVPELPEVDFVTGLLCEGDTTSFIDNSNAPGDSIIDFQWIIEGFGLMQGDSITVVFETPGTQQVRYQVSTQAGCVSTIVRDVNINSEPVAHFEMPVSFAEAPYQLILTPTQVHDQVNWFINDVLVSTSNELDTVLTENGSYDIGLEVYDESGCSNSIINNLFIDDITFDLELNNIWRNTEDDQVSIFAAITNNAVLPIDSFNIALNIDGNTVLRQVIQQTIEAGATLSNFELPFTLGEEAENNYLCLYVSLDETIYNEIDISNNSQCLYPQEFVINEVIPNPTEGIVYVKGFLSEDQTCYIELTNIEGKTFLYTEIEQNSSGFFNEEVAFSKLIPGTYFLKITSGTNQVIHKIFKN